MAYKVTYQTNLQSFSAIYNEDLATTEREASKKVRGSNRAGRWMRIVSIEEVS